MWTQSPDAALQVAAGLHRERLDRAERLRLARRVASSRSGSSRPLRHRLAPSIENGFGRTVAGVRRSTERRGAVPVPRPTGTC